MVSELIVVYVSAKRQKLHIHPSINTSFVANSNRHKINCVISYFPNIFIRVTERKLAVRGVPKTQPHFASSGDMFNQFSWMLLYSIPCETLWQEKSAKLSERTNAPEHRNRKRTKWCMRVVCGCADGVHTHTLFSLMGWIKYIISIFSCSIFRTTNVLPKSCPIITARIHPTF